MNIYIEHTDGKFYDASNIFMEYGFNSCENLVHCTFIHEKLITDKRDFEIESRVYFQDVGWTEVVGQEFCNNCDLHVKCSTSGNYDHPICSCYMRNDQTSVIFRAIAFAEQKENNPEIQETYYVYNKTMQNLCNTQFENENGAKNFAEKKLTGQTNDVFQVLKLVGECRAKIDIEWTK